MAYENPYPSSNPIAAGLSAAQQVIGIRGALQDQQDRQEDRTARRGLVDLQTEQAQLGVDRAKRDANREQQIDQWRRLATVGRQRIRAADAHFDSLAEFADGIQNQDHAKVQAAWPGVLSAFNDIHHDDIKKGVGEQLPDGSKIVDKEVTDFRATKDGRYVPVLNVTVEDKDGKRSSYEAPATEGRGSDPKSPLMLKSEDDLLGDLHGALETGLAARSGQLDPKQYDEWIRATGLELGVPPDMIDQYLGTAKPTGATRNVEKNGKPVIQERMSDGTWVDQEGVTPYEKQDGVRTVGRALVDAKGRVLYRDPDEKPASAREYEYAKKNGFKGTYAEFKTSATSSGSGSGSRSSQQQYLQYVADNVFGGDITKAYKSIRGGNTRQIAATIAGKMAELQKDGPRRLQKPYEELYSDAMQILENATADTNQSGAAGGEDSTAAPGDGADSSAAADRGGDGSEDYSSLWGAN